MIRNQICDQFLTGEDGRRRNEPDSGGGNQCRQISDLLPDHRPLYTNYSAFNRMQTAVFDDVYLSDENIVVGAPTASGKTTILELAILRLFSQNRFDQIKVKAVYVAPLKALCNEKFSEWQARFRTLGLTCCEFTGDSENDIYRITKHNIMSEKNYRFADFF
jgi:ATP-dependent DNA helicase HFM1/MER3